jgi:EPS-associated MarR family transcriptional regulator
MTQNHDTFNEDVRFRTLRLLQNKPDSSQRDIARELDVSLGTINYCLKALIDVGFVKVANFRVSQNKSGYAYFLTPNGISEKVVLTHRFLRRKIAEYEGLAAEIRAVEAELEGGGV